MLSLQHLTVSLGSTVVLRDACLDAGPGEAVCVVGEEGSGKTTLLKTITRELAPDEGVVKVDGAILARLPREVLRVYRTKIGYLPEEGGLDPTLTIARNVALPLDLAGTPVPERDRAVADLLKRLRLAGVADALPGRASRGERRLAAFARAIAAGPLIVLLDEPFHGVTDATAKVAATMLQNMRKKGATVIVATAEERTVSLFPGARVARLHRGKLAEETAASAPPAQPTRIRAEDVARAATAELVEKSTVAEPEPEPEPAPAPAERAERATGKKIRITSVGSL
jgi:ABC-type multidrug transport system ATPase subunit